MKNRHHLFTILTTLLIGTLLFSCKPDANEFLGKRVESSPFADSEEAIPTNNGTLADEEFTFSRETENALAGETNTETTGANPRKETTTAAPSSRKNTETMKTASPKKKEPKKTYTPKRDTSKTRTASTKKARTSRATKNTEVRYEPKRYTGDERTLDGLEAIDEMVSGRTTTYRPSKGSLDGRERTLDEPVRTSERTLDEPRGRGMLDDAERTLDDAASVARRSSVTTTLDEPKASATEPVVPKDEGELVTKLREMLRDGNIRGAQRELEAVNIEALQKHKGDILHIKGVTYFLLAEEKGLENYLSTSIASFKEAFETTRSTKTKILSALWIGIFYERFYLTNEEKLKEGLDYLKYILRHYPRTRFANDASYYMALIYKKLGNNDYAVHYLLKVKRGGFADDVVYWRGLRRYINQDAAVDFVLSEVQKESSFPEEESTIDDDFEWEDEELLYDGLDSVGSKAGAGVGTNTMEVVPHSGTTLTAPQDLTTGSGEVSTPEPLTVSEDEGTKWLSTSEEAETAIGDLEDIFP